jgi:hypothetical protein
MKLLEIADEFLAEAKAGIDGRSKLTEAEINDYLDSALALIREGEREGEREARHDAIVKLAREAESEIDYIEQVRRLVAYGLSQGKGGREEMRFLELMKTQPALDKSKGIRGITPAFEWLKANRPTIATALGKIIPPEPEPTTTTATE